MQKKLEIEFLGKKAKNPLVLPAGIMDLSFSGMKYAVENGAGIVTSKSLTLQQRSGHQTPVVAEFNGGMLNCMGLCNPGIEEGFLEINRFKEECDVPLIASIFATCEADFVSLIQKVNQSKADFVELNLSCPNVFNEFGIPLAASAEKVGSIIKAVKKISKLPVIAKLSPNVYNIMNIAKAAEQAGADALCLINTVGPGMAIDIHTVKPVLHNKFGGLSGPCVKPIALKLVYQVYSTVSIPIIGMGGVTTGEDAIEMCMAGASLIGVGTAVYYRGMDVFKKIGNEILDFLDKKEIEHFTKIPKLEKLK
jgi:dihydroorotate dehydrogenase (NAD+) catalytic subunit